MSPSRSGSGRCVTGSDPRVLLIVGAAYSGSTLLDLLLGTHRQAIGVGEVEQIDRFTDLDQYCTCGARAHSCSFWRGVLDRLPREPGDRQFRLSDLAGDRETALRSTRLLFRACAEVAGATVVIDSSKDYRRARAITESGMLPAAVVHLIRDGRAVVCSHRRRNEELEPAARHWRETNLAIRDWMQSAGAPPGLELHYEQLCRDPIRELSRVFGLVGLDVEEDILTRWRLRSAHNIGGNMMRYLESPELVEDSSWRDELTAEDLLRFERIARDLARSFGYD